MKSVVFTPTLPWYSIVIVPPNPVFCLATPVFCSTTMPRKRPVKNKPSLIDYVMANGQLWDDPKGLQQQLHRSGVRSDWGYWEKETSHKVSLDVIRKTIARARIKRAAELAEWEAKQRAANKPAVNKSEEIRELLAQGLTPAKVRDRLAEDDIYVSIDLIKTVRRNLDPAKRKKRKRIDPIFTAPAENDPADDDPVEIARALLSGLSNDNCFPPSEPKHAAPQVGDRRPTDEYAAKQAEEPIEAADFSVDASNARLDAEQSATEADTEMGRPSADQVKLDRVKDILFERQPKLVKRVENDRGLERWIIAQKMKPEEIADLMIGND